MTRSEFLETFITLVKKHKYRVYRKYPNVRGKNKDMRFGRALFAWCHLKEVDRGLMLTPILIVYIHKYYRRRIKRGKKAKLYTYLQERRAALKLGIQEYSYVVISAATDKEYSDLSKKQTRLAVALRKKMLDVCVVMKHKVKRRK